MSKHYVRLVGLIAVLLISVLDYFIVVDISLSILYLLPIVFTSWHGTRRFSSLLVFVSSVGWFLAEFSAKENLNFAILLWNTAVRLIVFLTIAHLLSSLKLAYEREKTLSQTDGLTKIVNRRFFLEILDTEYQRSLRYDCCFTLAYLDLDNFKQINDRFGHQTGDDLLKLVAQTLQKNIREIDTVARLGGDEFALLLPETNYQNGKLVLNRLQQQLMTEITAYSPPVSTSIGTITFLNVPESVDKILESVDNLMYKVKKSGKNGIEHQLFP
ncbi:diguanylate cyclase [Waterburya agarophytonicola K14]|uniref:Diguanylate cyclase n=1 Tax=Waterburya agarophytonicola KI4 TaxID=2874699 RepID=A0A964BRD0_9CYAN|nr:diguanylate cyclase [Waterburya agarophytonicola]MCC0178189.1 diguanylate cyclase [Waterburya agarophytonicola KI4]